MLEAHADFLRRYSLNLPVPWRWLTANHRYRYWRAREAVRPRAGGAGWLLARGQADAKQISFTGVSGRKAAEEMVDERIRERYMEEITACTFHFRCWRRILFSKAVKSAGYQ